MNLQILYAFRITSRLVLHVGEVLLLSWRSRELGQCAFSLRGTRLGERRGLDAASLLFASNEGDIAALNEKWAFEMKPAWMPTSAWCVWINCNDIENEGDFVCETDAAGTLTTDRSKLT